MEGAGEEDSVTRLQKLSREAALLVVLMVSAVPALAQEVRGSPLHRNVAVDPLVVFADSWLLHGYHSASALETNGRPGLLPPSRAESWRQTPPHWVLPVGGMLIGGGFMAWLATDIMMKADDWVAPPAHYYLVPFGMAVGLSLGLIANRFIPDRLEPY